MIERAYQRCEARFVEVDRARVAAYAGSGGIMADVVVALSGGNRVSSVASRPPAPTAR
jgi:hypothetical protein